MEEHWSSANFFRTFPRQKKVFCVWSKFYILHITIHLPNGNAVSWLSFILSFVKYFALLKMPNGILLIWLCSMLIDWKVWSKTKVLSQKNLAVYTSIFRLYKRMMPLSAALVLYHYTGGFSRTIWAVKTKLPSQRLFLIMHTFRSTYPTSVWPITSWTFSRWKKVLPSAVMLCMNHNQNAHSRKSMGC